MRKFISKPIVLIVLDGVGIAETSPGNAVTKARTPFLEKAWDSYPHTMLHASGEHVGLPKKIKGNSEVGHMNLGAGRIVLQDLPRINKSIEEGVFDKNAIFKSAFDHVTKHKSKLHLAVCFSDAGVHGTITHLEALIKAAKKYDLRREVIIHAFTDGRDSPPRSASTFLTTIQQAFLRHSIGSYGSLIGRYYSMDRNQIWDRVEKTYNALTLGDAYNATSWRDAIDQAYARGENDEFVRPTIIKTREQQDPTVQENDAFILLNYRADRALELSYTFIAPKFEFFKRKKVFKNLFFAGMTEYATGIPQNVAFPSEDLKLPLGRVLDGKGLRQLRIAESEKFPHVTYFFNGGRAIKFRGEDRIEIPSPDVPTYDQMPEMSLPAVTQTLLNKISDRTYDFILTNFANGDMVGHTGDLEAAMKAMEAIDHATEQVVSAVRSIKGTTIITADHGNVEEMINPKTGGMDTEHSDNPVPFIFIPPQQLDSTLKLSRGVLADVAPTILSYMGITVPAEMSGKNLLNY